MTVLVDTSVWFAALNIRDSDNARAKEILASHSPLTLTDYTLVETWNLARTRVSRAAAEGFWRGIRSGVASLERVSAADMDAAWSIGADFPDQDFSIVDRTSFAVMERLGITSVASFDHHFAVYRYGPKRDRAFQIVR
jgi:predicted nucleic acid-binding protein